MKVSSALRCGVISYAILSLAGCLGTDVNGSTSGLESSASGTGSGASTGTGGSPSNGSSSGGSATTTGGRVGGCPDGWQSCTPSNVCDNGCSPDGGECVDQLTANFEQTGATCDAGAACEGTTCIQTSGPQVPNLNGGVISHPNVVMMTFNDDPNQAALEDWGVWIMDGGYLPTTVGQYGIGNGSIQFVHLTDTAPAQDANSIQQYIYQHLASDPAMPAYSQSNIYELFFPSSWPGTSTFCQSQGGYHTFFGFSQSAPIYAVVAACQNDLQGNIEISGSHEIVEAVTDPYVQSWTFQSTSDPWSYLGGELGDMCESNSSHYVTQDGRYSAQYIWSNDAARLAQVPCQPWPSDQVYVQTLASPNMVLAAPGTVAEIPVVGWASAPIDSWALVAQDAFFSVNFATYPQMSSETIAPGQQVMARLNVPPATAGQPALGGLIGAAWIFSAVSNSQFDGSAMVGVEVSCETSADCSSETQSCTAGKCGYNYCSGSAAAFSKCAFDNPNDGVCLPFDTAGGGAVEICSQVGTLAAGSTGCQTSRIVGADPSSYCDATSVCEQGQSDAECLQVCSGVNSQGSCAANAFCFPLGQYYGFCLQECNPSSCPTSQSCYDFGGGLDLCYPN